MRTNIYVTDAASTGRRSRGRTARRFARSGRRRRASSRRCSTRRGRSRSRPRRCSREADRPATRSPASSTRQRRASSTTGSAPSDPYTLGVEEEYMLLDPESLDLVQHIETVLDAIEGDELASRINAELMQSVLEIATPVCRTAGDVMRELTTLRGYVRDVAARPGPPRRLGGHAPVQPLRAPADHGEGPLPRAHRPAPVRRAARADLRDAHPRRGRRPRQGDPGRQRAPPPARAAPRAVGELAVLARRADGARVEPADRVLRLPALRARRRASATTTDYAAVVGQLERTGLHRRLHAHLVGHPPAPEVGHDRGPHLRRRHARRGRRRDRRVLPGARQAALASATTRARRSRPTTGSSRPRTSGSRRATGSTRR